MMKRNVWGDIAAFVLLITSCVVCTIAAIHLFGCTPADRAAVAPLVEPAEKAACVLLRVEGVGEVCPTADELAPYAADLLRASAERPEDAGTPTPIARLPRARARRVVRCQNEDAGR